MGWNKKTKARLARLNEQTKALVQALNDNFSQDNGSNYKELNQDN
jgi:uncharacterized protein involved in tellurium resistance